jgi:hypothetical protein
MFNPLDIAFEGQPDWQGSKNGTNSPDKGKQKEEAAALEAAAKQQAKSTAVVVKAPGEKKKANSRNMIQQTVAESLFNLSCQDHGEQMILEEGGLQALNELSLSDDTRTLLYTSAAFANLTCNEPSRPAILEGKIISAITACVEGRAWNKEVREHCARALCRLSCSKETEREMVQENPLAFPTITKLIGTINEGPSDTWYCAETCVRAAINILHIGCSETPFLISAVMQCLKTMSATGTRENRKFCALSIRNMSCLAISVDKIVECGAVYVISNVLSEYSFDPPEFEKGHPLHGISTTRAAESDNISDSRARRNSQKMVNLDHGPKMAPADVLTVLTHCATALCNMGCIRSVRENLLRDKIVLVLTRIVAYAVPLAKTDEFAQILEWCALTLSSMTHQEELREKLISDNIIPPLAVLVGLKSLPAMRAVAYALAALSWKKEGCVAVVDCGCASAILDFVDCDDIQVKQDSTLLLSNILSNENLYITVVDCGVISVLNRLAIWTFKNKSSSVGPPALAIAAAPPTPVAKPTVAGRQTTAMVQKKKQEEAEALGAKKAKQLEEDRLKLIADAREEISHACALSFFNVTCHDKDPSIRLRIVKEGILLGLIRLLAGKNDVINQQRAVGAMRNLSNEEANQERISSEGVVEKLVAVTDVMTEQAKADCVAIICNLARVEVLRGRVVSDGGCGVLVSFSNINNDDIKLYCSMALCCLSNTVPLVEEGVFEALVNLAQSANTVVWCALAMSQLSSHERSRKLMLRDKSVIPGLVQMMRSSDSRSQLHGSIALCNLSTNTLAKKAIYDQQEYDNLIVITLLRVNEVETKEICAKILYNLLTNADTRRKMINNLFAYAFIRLAKLNSSEIQYLCVKVLFNLSCNPELGNEIVEHGAMPILIAKSCSRCSLEVCRLSAGSLCNLSSHTANIPMMVKEGVVAAAVSLVTKQDVETIQRVAMLLCNLSWDESSIQLLVEQDCVPTLVRIINAKIPFCRELCATCLCNLSQTTDKDVRARIVRDGAIVALAKTIACTVEKAIGEGGDDGAGGGGDKPRHNMLRPPTASSVKLEPDPGMNVDTTLDVIRTLCNLCGHNNKAARSTFVLQSGVKSLVALHTNLLDGEQDEADAELDDYDERVQHVLAAFASLVCDLSRQPRTILRVLEERAVSLLRDAAGMSAPDTRLDCAVALSNLSFHREGHPLMVRHGAIEALAMLCPKVQDDGSGGSDGVIGELSTAEVDELIAPYLGATLRNLTSNAAARQALVKQEQTLPTLFLLSTSVDEPTRANVAIALYNLTDTKQLRSKMVEEGVAKVFIRLSEQSSEDPAEDEVTQVCTAGLQNLIRFIKQSGQLQSMDSGLVKSLLRMIDKDMDDWIFDSKKLAKALPQPKFRGNIQTHRHVGWVPRAAELRPDWRDVTIAGVKIVQPDFPTHHTPYTTTSHPRYAPMPDFILRSFDKMNIDNEKADLDMDFEATYRDPLRVAEEEAGESSKFEEEDDQEEGSEGSEEEDSEEEDSEEEEDDDDEEEEDGEEEEEEYLYGQEELGDSAWLSEFAREEDEGGDQAGFPQRQPGANTQLPALMRPNELFEAMASPAADLNSPWSTMSAPGRQNMSSIGLAPHSSLDANGGESWFSIGAGSGMGRSGGIRPEDDTPSRSAPAGEYHTLYCCGLGLLTFLVDAGLTMSGMISSFESTPLMSQKQHRGGRKPGGKLGRLSTSPLQSSRVLAKKKKAGLMRKKQIVR